MKRDNKEEIEDGPEWETEETMRMKCLDCLYEEDGERYILLECAELSDTPYPQVICPKCNHGTMVPIEEFPALHATRSHRTEGMSKKEALGRPRKNK